MPTANQAHTTLGLLRSTANRIRCLLRRQPVRQLGPVTLAIASRGNLSEFREHEAVR